MVLRCILECILLRNRSFFAWLYSYSYLYQCRWSQFQVWIQCFFTSSPIIVYLKNGALKIKKFKIDHSSYELFTSFSSHYSSTLNLIQLCIILFYQFALKWPWELAALPRRDSLNILNKTISIMCDMNWRIMWLRKL